MLHPRSKVASELPQLHSQRNRMQLTVPASECVRWIIPEFLLALQVASPVWIIFIRQNFSHLSHLVAGWACAGHVAVSPNLLWSVSPGKLAPFLMNLLPVLCLAILVTVVSHLTLAAPQEWVGGYLRHVECSKGTWNFHMLPTIDGAVKANRHKSWGQTMLLSATIVTVMSHSNYTDYTIEADQQTWYFCNTIIF